jgi:AmmeMemoRadiSam system protein B
MRQPVVAGQFYESDFNGLDEQIRSSFTHKLGPGELPLDRREGAVKAIISPHAGYVFSGPCAAWAFKEIAESRIPDFFIMLGPSHAGHPTCFSDEDWETPFGLVKSNKSYVAQLSKATGIPVDNAGHHREHSIEVQLPFLQFSCRSHLQRLRIAPLMVSHDINVHELGPKLSKAIKETGKSACFIVSSDFTHYGVNYGYMPFSDHPKENMYRLDRAAIKLIERNKPDAFLSYIDRTGATICGALPIGLLLEAVTAEKIRKLQYYTSGDIVGDYSSAVGYAAVLFT